MLKFLIQKSILLALLLGLWAANARAQGLQIAPPPVSLSPAQSNSVEEDEFTPSSIAAPSGGLSGEIEEQEPPTAPFPAPPPLPEISLEPAVAPPAAIFTTAPTPQDFERITPVVEVWSSGATVPDVPPRYGGGRLHHQRLGQARIIGTAPVTVRLQFHSSASGKNVIVRPAWGITPSSEVLQVDANGECILALSLQPDLVQSQVTFFCDGLITSLPLVRVPAAAGPGGEVDEYEEELPGGGK